MRREISEVINMTVYEYHEGIGWRKVEKMPCVIEVVYDYYEGIGWLKAYEVIRNKQSIKL